MTARIILILIMYYSSVCAYAQNSLDELIDLNLDTRKETNRELDETHRQIEDRIPNFAISELRPARVWLHIRDDEQHVVGSNLQELIGDGIELDGSVRAVEWMPIQTVSNGPSQAQIRFFKEADAMTAEALRAIIGGSAQSIEILNLTKEYASSTWIKTGHIEIWLAPQPHPPTSPFQACQACPEMVIIPSGSFLMGSPPEEEGRGEDELQHTVTVGAFAIAKTEVTFNHWTRCVDGGGCRSNQNPGNQSEGDGSRPVFNVSWNDAQEYVQWLNTQHDGPPFRLPTEAEWEAAARGGTTGRYSNNGGEAELCDIARHANCAFPESVAEVASLTSNRFGLFDMHGNVWEWVEDVYEKDYGRTPANGKAHVPDPLPVDHERVLRSGSFNDTPNIVRSANRSKRPPDRHQIDVGFRVAQTLP